MASVTFYIDLEVQNVETQDHVDAITTALEGAASLLRAHAVMILGEQCTPKLSAYGVSFERGRFPITLRTPDEVE